MNELCLKLGDSANNDAFHVIPDEILDLILSFLPQTSIPVAAIVCWSWNRTVKSPYFWSSRWTRIIKEINTETTLLFASLGVQKLECVVNERLTLLTTLKHLRCITFSSETNAILPHILPLTKLVSLYLPSSDDSKPSLLGLTSLCNLQSLDLRWASRLDDDVLIQLSYTLTALTNLNVMGSNCVTFEIIPSLTRFKSLHLSFSPLYLTSLPEDLMTLTSLKDLEIRNGQLSSLPLSTSRLTSLVSLYCNHNFLTDFPPCIPMLQSLSCLNLGGNHLVTLPNTVSKLTRLTSLDLQKNQLKYLPDSIVSLPLLSLGLRLNQFQSIPLPLCQLTALQELYFQENIIDSIPPAFSQLTGLTHLSLSHNRLNYIPQCLLELTQLRHIFLAGNGLPIPLMPWDSPANFAHHFHNFQFDANGLRSYYQQHESGFRFDVYLGMKCFT